MPKNTKQNNKKPRKGNCGKKSLIIVVILSVLLVVSLIFNVIFLCNNSKTAIENKKLSVFNDLAYEYIYEHDLTDNDVKEWYQMTGYGISNEDNVFYITFKYADYTKCTDANCDVDEKYGVMYFWPSEHSPNGYSHAYSYHENPYHPDGEYVELKN